MPAHRIRVTLVRLLVLLLTLPALCQRTNLQTRINQTVDQRQQQISQVPPSAEVNVKAARLQALHQDARELSALSASMQADLRKLQSGLMAKDLNANLKKMEKLSKRLRREIE